MADTDWEAAYARDLTSETALNIGCGAGQNCIWLAQQGWNVHGVDIAQGAIRRAEVNVTEHTHRTGSCELPIVIVVARDPDPLPGEA